MKTEVSAIFDIGKTNKKFFLFDKNFNVLDEKVRYIDPVQDDEGDECENIEQLTEWINTTLNGYLTKQEFNIKGVNFSAYGASFVHLDDDGLPCLPLYNYLKKLPEEILDQFLTEYGPREVFSRDTAAPVMSKMLNSGLQLYWLKNAKPKSFEKIRFSLHLPQYCSYIINKAMCSEISSIGCHTGLWDFRAGDYHKWVYNENINKLLPPIKSVYDATPTVRKHNNPIIGTGVHDSSAALFPYLEHFSDPFVLISTGTWSVTMNPFSADFLSTEDIRNDCLNYLSVNGNPVRASRLFLGNEHHVHVKRIAAHFNVSEDAFQQLKFDPLKAMNVRQVEAHDYATVESDQLIDNAELSEYSDHIEAYYQLVSDLAHLQTQSVKKAIGSSNIKNAILTGGFYNNDVFLRFLATNLKDLGIELKIATLKRASAVGAAMVLKLDFNQEASLDSLFKLKKIEPK